MKHFFIFVHLFCVATLRYQFLRMHQHLISHELNTSSYIQRNEIGKCTNQYIATCWRYQKIYNINTGMYRYKKYPLVWPFLLIIVHVCTHFGTFSKILHEDKICRFILGWSTDSSRVFYLESKSTNLAWFVHIDKFPHVLTCVYPELWWCVQELTLGDHAFA